MSAGSVHIEIYQGEDWTADIIWVDQYGQGVGVQHPCRRDIKAKDKSTLFTLETDPDLPDDEIPTITYSNDIGLIQLHIPASVTKTFPPSQYVFDLFVTTDVDEAYGGSQVTPVLSGPVTVRPRVTVMS